MAEYAEWGEGTAGIVAAECSYADDSNSNHFRDHVWRISHRDAVVCLVDASESMFEPSPVRSSFVTQLQEEKSSCRHDGAFDEKQKSGKEGWDTTTGPVAPGNGIITMRTANKVHSGASTCSSFSLTMQSILALFKEKIVCSSRDVVAVVLYHTKTPSNVTDFRGVYIVQEAACVGAECIQKMERLKAAGVYGSVAYHAFKDQIGHWPASTAVPSAVLRGCVSTSPQSMSPDEQTNSVPPFRFSEALWVAQRILLGVCRAQEIRYRRLFVFTNDADPTRGDAHEWKQCCSRARDLGMEGVELEVFGFSAAVSNLDEGVRDATGDPDDAAMTCDALSTPAIAYCTRTAYDKTTRSLDYSLDASDAWKRESVMKPVLAPTGRSGECDTRACPIIGSSSEFVQEQFWGPLLKNMQASYALQSSAKDKGCAAYTADNEAVAPTAGGAVYVNVGAGNVHQLLNAVARRAHPQRPFRNCLLRIGGLSRGMPHVSAMAQKVGTIESAAGPMPTVPLMAVSLYTPLMRSAPLPNEWLDGRTNRMLRRVVHLHARTSMATQGDTVISDAEYREDGPPVAGDASSSHRMLNEEEHRREAAADTEVKPEDIRYYATAGKERVVFTREERAKIAEIAAAGSEPGFTVLFFKDIRDALRREHIIQRCSFLHACAQHGGTHSHRLFVLFVRRLRVKQRAAIAQYRSEVSVVPRLVALVPSLDLTADQERCDQLPAEGLGLWVVPLPYAEEIRTVPDLNTCTLVNRSAAPVLEDSTVDPAHLVLAEHLVRALTVSYELDAVQNPMLQRQYSVLQDVARRLYRATDSMSGLGSGVSACTGDNVGEQDAVQCSGFGGDVGHSGDEAPQPQELDNTLPDYAGMQRYAELFHQFNREVLGSEYDAATCCSLWRAIGPLARRPRDEKGNGAVEAGPRGQTPTLLMEKDAPIMDLIRDAADRNAWHELTIPQLRAFLTQSNAKAAHAKRKAELVDVVKQHLFAS